jgi:Rap1a immunity proteins
LQVPPRTVRDLLALCSAGRGDATQMAAVAFCNGYVEGAVIVEKAHGMEKNAHPLFCLPSPPPTHNQALAAFTTWADAQPTRLDKPAIDGLFTWLAETYPCGKHM